MTISVHYGCVKPWTTRMELDFVARIGTHRNSLKMFRGNARREQLLRRYLAAGSQRGDWDGINHRKVLAFARNELIRESARRRC